MSTEVLHLRRRERAHQLSILDDFRNVVPSTHHPVMERYLASALTYVLETDRLVVPEGVLVAYLLGLWATTRIDVGTLTVAGVGERWLRGIVYDIEATVEDVGELDRLLAIAGRLVEAGLIPLPRRMMN